DLADRALLLTLEPISEERRLPESELWETFEAERPRILGALLDGAVPGIKKLPQTKPEWLPRMADFALWATACESAFWPDGTSRLCYLVNQETMVEGVLDADPVAMAVRTLMSSRQGLPRTPPGLLS